MIKVVEIVQWMVWSINEWVKENDKKIINEYRLFYGTCEKRIWVYFYGTKGI